VCAYDGEDNGTVTEKKKNKKKKCVR